MSNENKIIDMREHRQRRRKRYLSLHGDRLDSFIGEYVESNMPFDLNDLTQIYLGAMQTEEFPGMSHLDFREVVSTAINYCLGKDLIEALQANTWYDRSFISDEEVIDRSTSYFILRKGQVANS